MQSQAQNLSRSILKSAENIPRHAMGIMQLQSQNNERLDFLLYFSQNTLHLRYVAPEFQVQEAVHSKERVQTPLATKEFLAHFYEPDGTKTVIRQVAIQKSSAGRPEALIVLGGVLDTLVFRLPLAYFYVQITQKKITAMTFTMKPSELQQMTRNYDRFKNIQQISPLTTEQYVAYDENHQSVVLFNLSDVTSPTIRLRHSHTQFPLVQQPSNIYVDKRGLKQAQIVSGNQIWLINDRLAAVDMFEYFRGTQGRQTVDIREVEIKNGVRTKYSYFKQLFPLNQLPLGFRPEVNKLIASSAAVSSDQFLIVICMNWLPKEATAGNNSTNTQPIQTDMSMIQNLKAEFFQEHNIFVFNTKKLVSALALDYVADLACTSPDGSILYLGNQQTGTIGQFKVNQHQQLQCEAVQQMAQPIKTILAGKYHAICVNQTNGVVCFKKAGHVSTPVSIWCPQSFGSIHLPKQPKKDQLEKSVKFGGDNDVTQNNRSGYQRIGATNQSFQQNKTIMESEILDRLRNSKIPGVDNSQSLVSSLFSPANESMRRRRLQKFHGLGSELEDILNEPVFDSEESEKMPTIGSIQELAAKTGDTKLDVQLVDSMIQSFQHYYALYEKLRIIEEYIILLLNPKVEDSLIQKLPKGMKQLFDEHIADCAITVANARYFIGYQEFYYQEMRYINAKLQQLLNPFKEDFDLDLYQIEMIQQFVDGNSVVSNFLGQFHEQIDSQIDDVYFSISDIYGVIYQEFIDQHHIPIPGQTKSPNTKSLMDLIAQKTQQLTEYFRQISLYRTKALTAFQYAATHKDSSILQSAKLDGIAMDVVNNPTYNKSLSGQAKMINEVANINDQDFKKQINSQEIKNFQSMPDDMFDQMQRLSEMRQNENKQSSVVQMPKKSITQVEQKEQKAQSPNLKNFNPEVNASRNSPEQNLERAKKLQQSMMEMQKSIQKHIDQSRSNSKQELGRSSSAQIPKMNEETDSYTYEYVYEEDDDFAIEKDRNVKKRVPHKQKEKSTDEYQLEQYQGRLSSDSEDQKDDLTTSKLNKTKEQMYSPKHTLGSQPSQNSQIVSPLARKPYGADQDQPLSNNLTVSQHTMNNSVQKIDNTQDDNKDTLHSQESVISTINTSKVQKNNPNQLQNKSQSVTSPPITQEKISAQYQGQDNLQKSKLSEQFPSNTQNQSKQQDSPLSTQAKTRLLQSYNQNIDNLIDVINIQQSRIQRLQMMMPSDPQIRQETETSLNQLDNNLIKVQKQLQTVKNQLKMNTIQNAKTQYVPVEKEADNLIKHIQQTLPVIEKRIQEAIIAESQVKAIPNNSQYISSNINSRSASNMAQSHHDHQSGQQPYDSNALGYGSQYQNQSPTRNPFRNVKGNQQQGAYPMYYQRDPNQEASQLSAISNNSFINTSFYRENIGKVNMNTEMVTDQIQHMSRQELQHYLDIMNYNRQSLLKVSYKIRQNTFRQDLENLPRMPQSRLMRKIAQDCNNQQIQAQSEKALVQPKYLQRK